MRAVVIGSGGDQSAELDCAFAGNCVEADQVHRDAFEHGELVRGMVATRASGRPRSKAVDALAKRAQGQPAAPAKRLT